VFKPKPTPPPEPTTDEFPLKSGGIMGPLEKMTTLGWESVLHDDHRRTFVAHRKQVFPAETLREWWRLLENEISWRRPSTGEVTSEGEDVLLPRSTAWLTGEACKCKYEYGKVKVDPQKMAPWFQEITDRVSRECGLVTRPNSCNANYYENGMQAVGWHSDDERLFNAVHQDSLILSLSLGATRSFELAAKDKPMEIIKIPLANGDLCTMEGLCQKHYRHRVPRQKALRGPRINLTWRWVLKHDPGCPCGRTQY